VRRGDGHVGRGGGDDVPVRVYGPDNNTAGDCRAGRLRGWRAQLAGGGSGSGRFTRQQDSQTGDRGRTDRGGRTGIRRRGAVSPGTNTCSFVIAAALTVIAGLVLAVLVPSVVSVAVTVALPGVRNAMLKVLVPRISAVSAGRVASASEELRLTVSLIVSTRF